MIHWRSSARLGALQVRELEVITGGQEIIICLDSGGSWEEEDFERAVVAAGSLYVYAARCQLNVQLWTAATGLLHGNRVVLEALAATSPEEDSRGNSLPCLPLIWLTQNLPKPDTLPGGSRWVFFPRAAFDRQLLATVNTAGLVINGEQPLERELQKPI